MMLWKKAIFLFLVFTATLLTVTSPEWLVTTVKPQTQIVDGTEPPPPPMPWPRGTATVTSPRAGDTIQIADGTEPPPPPMPWPTNAPGKAA
jgi:hypothetical protein